MSRDRAHFGSVELRGISRRFTTGAGSCTIAVTALRRVSVEIRCGEALVVAGPIGAGKTTLLLCAAGLLRCDSGSVIGSARPVIYRDLTLPARPIDPLIPGAVLLLDSCDDLPDLARHRATRVVAQGLSIGAAVVVAARDPSVALELIPADATMSMLHLRLGETSAYELPSRTNRVAEAPAVVAR